MKFINSREELNKNDEGLIVWLDTGLVFMKGIFFENENNNSDLLGLLDEAFLENKDTFPVSLYDTDELTQEELESYIPLNGGEKYIAGIVLTEII